ncbi:MAG: ABC transporter permease [Chloroflexota bacterium]|nr:ABC transporter permease [Chloroflexota bacterium]MDE2947819.1 ABC transporter permease [Chloroflexota bacterium]
MRQYIVKRLLLSIPTILGAITLLWFLMQLAPGDPALMFVPPDFQGEEAEAYLAKVNELYGFNDPLPVQYLRYMRNTLQFDFGTSLRTMRPVSEDLLRRIPNSLRLGVSAFMVSTAMGIALGVLAAIKRGTWVDSALMVFALVGVSMPNFWFAYVLILLFGLYLRILPPSGLGGLKHMILPTIVLGYTSAGYLTRYVRSSMLEVINHDYVRTARAKGVAERNVLIKHVLRNGLLPVVNVLGINVAFILAGSVIIETLFAWPGVGLYLIDGVVGRDFPVVQGAGLLIATSVVLVNLLTDVMLVYVDPRIRYE